MIKYCTVIRVLALTQMKGLKQKKAHLMEIQINGGDVAKKVDYAYSFFEKQILIDSVFQKDERIDIIGVTKGKGYEGVVTCWGVAHLLARPTVGSARLPMLVLASCWGFIHRCSCWAKWISSQNGDEQEDSHSATTEFDRTEKDITPMGGFPDYGVVKDDYLLIKGCCVGPKKRVVTLSPTLLNQTSRVSLEDIKA